MKPSILIPTRNRPAMFRWALESAVSQTLECEIVVVDASDNDETEHECRIFDGADIVYQRLVRNAGFLPAWYLCAAMARGDVVHYQLDDDWIEPDFMERCVPLLTDDVGAVLTQALVHFEDGSTQVNLPTLPDRDGMVESRGAVELLMSLPLTLTPAAAVLRRSDVLQSLHVNRIPGAPRITPCADSYMMLSALASRGWVAWVAAPLAHLGAHAGGFTINAMQTQEGHADLVAQYAEVKAAWRANR